MPTLINLSVTLDRAKRFADTIFLTQGEYGMRSYNSQTKYGWGHDDGGIFIPKTAPTRMCTAKEGIK